MNQLNISEFFNNVSKISIDNIRINDNWTYEKNNFEKMNFLDDIPKFILKDKKEIDEKKNLIIEKLNSLSSLYEKNVNFNLIDSINNLISGEFNTFNFKENTHYFNIERLFKLYNEEKLNKISMVEYIKNLKFNIIENKNNIKEELLVYNKQIFDINFKYKMFLTVI